MIIAAPLPSLPISSTAFDELKASIKGDIVLPTDPTYNESLIRWSASGQKKAGMTVFPKDDEDILRVLEVVVKEKVDLALKGEKVGGGGAVFFEDVVLASQILRAIPSTVTPTRSDHSSTVLTSFLPSRRRAFILWRLFIRRRYRSRSEPIHGQGHCRS